MKPDAHSTTKTAGAAKTAKSSSLRGIFWPGGDLNQICQNPITIRQAGLQAKTNRFASRRLLTRGIMRGGTTGRRNRPSYDRKWSTHATAHHDADRRRFPYDIAASQR